MRRHSENNPIPIATRAQAFLVRSGRSQRRPTYRIDVPVAPLVFPSLGHFDERVSAAIEHAGSVRGLRESTARWARHGFVRFREFLVESDRSRDFLSGRIDAQTATLESWIAFLRSRGLSRVTINNYWRGLASIFRWITRADGSANPLLFVETPRPGRSEPMYLTRADAEQVVRWVRNCDWGSDLTRTRNVLIIGLLLLAGLRRGEVARLEFGDVNLERGTLAIRNAKGIDGGRSRTAWMPSQLREMMAAYIDARRKAGRTHPQLLTDIRHDRGVGHAVIMSLCRTITRKSGIHVRPHALRHTFATLVRQAGISDRVAMGSWATQRSRCSSATRT